MRGNEVLAGIFAIVAVVYVTLALLLAAFAYFKKMDEEIRKGPDWRDR